MIYAYVFFAIFAIMVVLRYKENNLFENNLTQQLTEKDENYFEVRYLKAIPFLYIALSIPPLVVFLQLTFGNKVDLSFGYRITYFCIGLGLLGAAVFNYIRKERRLIVFDHGQITLYSGKKVKISGNINQIERVNRSQQIWGAQNHIINIPYQIIFSSNKYIEFNEFMDNSYKLVAFFEKGNYFKKSGRFSKKNKKEKK